MKLWLMYNEEGWENEIFYGDSDYKAATHLCVAKHEKYYECDRSQKGNNLITEDDEFYLTLMGWVLTGDAYLEEIER